MDHHHQHPDRTADPGSCHLCSLEGKTTFQLRISVLWCYASGQISFILTFSAFTDGLLQEKIQGILKRGNDGLTYPAASSPVTDCLQRHQAAQRLLNSHTARGDAVRPTDTSVLRHRDDLEKTISPAASDMNLAQITFANTSCSLSSQWCEHMAAERKHLNRRSYDDAGTDFNLICKCFLFWSGSSVADTQCVHIKSDQAVEEEEEGERNQASICYQSRISVHHIQQFYETFRTTRAAFQL